MIISDLEHLEAVREENQIEGGVQLVSGSSASSSGLATTGSVYVGNSSYSSANQSTYYYRYGGTSNSTSASGSAFGYTSPGYYYYY
jgi:hypothetical protein